MCDEVYHRGLIRLVRAAGFLADYSDRVPNAMTDDTIRIQFEVTLDDVADYDTRMTMRTKWYRRLRFRSLIFVGAVAGFVGVSVAAALLRRVAGVELLVGAAFGAFALSLCGRLYDRGVIRRSRALMAERFGTLKPTQCAIELRPACLWHWQDGKEAEFEWSAIKAVHDRPYGVELWLDHAPLLATNNAFATPSDRERFINRARASLVATPADVL